MEETFIEYENENKEIVRIYVEEKKRKTRGKKDEEGATNRAAVSFERAIGTIKSTADSMKKIIDSVNPDEAQVEFSLKAGGEAGFFGICKAASEAEFKITLKWT